MKHVLNSRRKLLITFLIAASLASACSERVIIGSSKDTAVLKPTATSVFADVSSTSSIASAPEFAGKINWSKCNGDDGGSQDKIQCGTLEVPYDYDNPNIGSFKLFLTRNSV